MAATINNIPNKVRIGWSSHVDLTTVVAHPILTLLGMLLIVAAIAIVIYLIIEAIRKKSSEK